MATGQDDSKFGLAPADARRAIERLRGSDRLRLDGLHVHIGSQILDAAPFGQAVAALAAYGRVRRLRPRWRPRRALHLRRPPAERGRVPRRARRRGARAPAAGGAARDRAGRSLVARAGVTIYSVVTVKRGARTFVAVDGGMGDNLEVSLYGQRFEATVADRVGGGEPVDLVGRHCESGDVLVGASLLREPRVGDVVAVPATAPIATRCATATTARAARRSSS